MSEKENKQVIMIDTSELDDYQLCEFKHYAVQDLHLRPKDPSKPMDGGSLLHYYLEMYYKFKRDTVQSLPDIIEQVIELGRVKALDFPILEPNEVSDTNFQFREYCRYYENEQWIPLYIEQPFIFPFYEDDFLKIYLTGKPDLVFRYMGTQKIAVCDHKKSSRAFTYSPMRNQFPLYAIATGTDTVIVNKVGFQKTLSLKERMVRQSFVYHRDLLEEWKTDTLYWIKRLLLSMETGVYARNRTSCEKWNGCFLERYCMTRREARAYLIGSEYVIGEKWDVTKSLNLMTANKGEEK